MIVFETERLILRQITSDDAQFVIALLNEPAYIENIADHGIKTRDDARRHIAQRLTASYEKNGFGLFGVVLQDSAELIGMCGLIKRDSLPDVDIGYAFLERFWGKGYAFESAEATLTYGRDEIGLKRIVAITGPENLASVNLMRKLGMQYEKTYKLAGYEGDTVQYGIEF